MLECRIPKMKPNVRSVWILLILPLMGVLAQADSPPETNAEFRVLSWNIAEDCFVRHEAEFQAMLLRANANILLLDEVAPSANAKQIHKLLAGLRPEQEETWHINFGKSGGRQVGVIASLFPLESLTEFSAAVPYPEVDRLEILRRMSRADRSNRAWSMDGGIPVNAAVIRMGNRRLLTVAIDLQCCGSNAESWQEFRRLAEAREIRRLIRQVLDRITVDGIIVSGDFNMVVTHGPLVVLTGPYREPHANLTAVETHHLDGTSTWTWDGRGTPFPSSALDFQLYDAQALQVRSGLILDSEDLPPGELERYGIQHKTSSRLSDHRPLVVEYDWRTTPVQPFR